MSAGPPLIHGGSICGGSCFILESSAAFMADAEMFDVAYNKK